jgi:pimeloyl-ACP methyl ester carboxylesterase
MKKFIKIIAGILVALGLLIGALVFFTWAPDRLIPPDNGERFHREIAGSQLVVFKNLGHAPQEEDPARTVAVAKQFLSIQ